MIIGLRLLRVFLSIVVCILVFVSFFEFFVSLRDIESFRRNEPVWGVFLWGLMFRGPGSVFFGTVPMLMILCVMEYGRVQSKFAYLAVWSVIALLVTGFTSPRDHKILAAIGAALVAGFAYWLLTGRTAGNWRGHWRDERSSPKISSLSDKEPEARNGRKDGKRDHIRFASFKRIGNFTAYVILAYFAFQLLGYLHYGGKMLWANYVAKSELQKIPFKRTSGRIGISHLVALMDFPDAKSCLVDGLDANIKENLKRMDWDRIDNDAEAEICTFHLLAAYPDVSFATGWLEAQGFRVSENFSSAKPYKMPNGSLSVQGSWNLRANGPKYPTGGVVRRMFRSIPYGMSIETSWSPDGTKLLAVRYTFSTL